MPRLLKAYVETISSNVNAVMEAIKEMRCKEWDRNGSLFTVIIQERTDKTPSRSERVVTGHGLVLVSGVGAEQRSFLLSAAHVFVELMHLQCSKKKDVEDLEKRKLFTLFQLLWRKDENPQDHFTTRTDIRLVSFHIPKIYVSNGINDVGLAEIDPVLFSQRMTQSTGKFGYDSLVLKSPKGTVGAEVIGHGRILMNGKVGSCSGSPILDYKGRVVAVVHGASKHRGCHSSANGKHGDAVSTFYAD